MGTASLPDAPEQSHPLLRKMLPKRLQPLLRGIRKRWQRRRLRLAEPYYTVYPFTQVSRSRQENLARIAGIIEAEGVPGAVVECGVLDGGTAGLMAHFTAQSGRPVHLFDAWQGLPTTTAEDGEGAKKWEGEAVGSPRRVSQLMKLLRIDPERIHYHVGWFHETFPKVDIPQIALLHVDCDFHDPVKLTLEHWYPHVASGGFIQVDDYNSFAGCTKAVDDFLQTHPELQLETFGQMGTAYFLRKP